MSKPFAAVCAAPVVDYAEVMSADELEALLRRIARECKRPVLATVRRADGDMLSIGLGRPFSVLTYVGADEDPPYLTSVGGAAPAERVHFDYHGEPSEFSRHNAVGTDEAFAVVRAFVQSSGLPLPQVVSWEEV
jgi:hypothetical protein